MKRVIVLGIGILMTLTSFAQKSALMADRADFSGINSGISISRAPSSTYSTFAPDDIPARRRTSRKGLYITEKEQRAKAEREAELSAETTTNADGTITAQWSDGTKYRGQMYYGEIKGVGTMIYADGSKYCGEWAADLPNGNGTFMTPEGVIYSVKWVNGLPHGKGVIQDLDGRLYSARWVGGELKQKSIKPLER